MRRISLLAQKNAPLRLSFSEGTLTVSAQTPDVGEASEAIPVPFHGEPFEIGFNPEFLRDGLESIESDGARAEADQPAAPGPDRITRHGRLRVPDHAHPPERVSAVAARVLSVQLRDFRSYARAEAALGGALTRRARPQRRRQDNLLEALYFGCTGRSPRTRNERELVRFGAQAARVAVQLLDGDEPHELAVGFGAAAGAASRRSA